MRKSYRTPEDCDKFEEIDLTQFKEYTSFDYEFPMRRREFVQSESEDDSPSRCCSHYGFRHVYETGRRCSCPEWYDIRRGGERVCDLLRQARLTLNNSCEKIQEAYASATATFPRARRRPVNRYASRRTSVPRIIKPPPPKTPTPVLVITPPDYDEDIILHKHTKKCNGFYRSRSSPTILKPILKKTTYVDDWVNAELHNERRPEVREQTNQSKQRAKSIDYTRQVHFEDQPRTRARSAPDPRDHVLYKRIPMNEVTQALATSVLACSGETLRHPRDKYRSASCGGIFTPYAERRPSPPPSPPSPAPSSSRRYDRRTRELPQYGHKQWHSYFGRTFDVYTKLWKFQQQHRAILDAKYGLKRWQIGEIASKIGQLYYHFYLRTSETTYLNEAFSFYYAIRARCYYTKAAKEDKCELMVKKLRYYARFMVVCLLIKKMSLVRELAKELDRQIVDYGTTYDPDDQIEWNTVVDEAKSFIQAEPIVSVIHPDKYCVKLSYRLGPINIPPVERTQQMNLTLQQILIIGNNTAQVKFSELTMDMYRFIQTVEREPSPDLQHMYDDSPRNRYNLPTPCAPISKCLNLDGSPRRDNPHKFLLYKPTPTQVLVYLASGCNDLSPGGALLHYISADGQLGPGHRHPDEVGYGSGGVITASKTDLHRECKDAKSSSQKVKDSNCFYPGDLYPFTRHPMFIIIDSDNSFAFQTIPRHFGQPLVILMSPIETPSQYNDRRHQGSLFTLFLHSPLSAICYICDVRNISLALWERAHNDMENFMIEVSQLVHRHRIDLGWISFLGDDFLRLLVYRYIFCEVSLRMHRAFRNRNQLPKAIPPLPEELLESSSLIHLMLDLVDHLQLRNHFNDPTAGPSGTQSSSRSNPGE